jgi:hypothetical protein
LGDFAQDLPASITSLSDIPDDFTRSLRLASARAMEGEPPASSRTPRTSTLVPLLFPQPKKASKDALLNGLVEVENEQIRLSRCFLRLRSKPCPSPFGSFRDLRSRSGGRDPLLHADYVALGGVAQDFHRVGICDHFAGEHGFSSRATGIGIHWQPLT